MAAEQGNINKQVTHRLVSWPVTARLGPIARLLQVREVDTTVASITGSLQDRQRKYSIHCSKLASVREVRGMIDIFLEPNFHPTTSR